MKEYQVAGHEPSLLPDGKNFRLAWADEFDGTELDRSKWEFRLSMMGKRWKSWTDSEKALYLDGNSNAVFRLIEDETDGHLCFAHLQTGANYMDEPVEEFASDQGDGASVTKDDMHWKLGRIHEQKKLFLYGYFECRARLQQLPGWWSAFWMQSPMIGATLDPHLSGSEVDIMESFRPGTMNWNNIFTGGYGKQMRRQKLGPSLRDLDKSVYHRFGLLWEKDRYTFYVDGEKTYETTEDISAVPEFLLISTEVYGYRKKADVPGAKQGYYHTTADHVPVQEAYGSVGDAFLVDYVRVFEFD